MRRNSKVRCVHHCPHFVSTAKDDSFNGDGIGYCKLYNLTVIDTLCGCETRDGKTILQNFNGKKGDEEMKSKPYKFNGNLFRYDFGRSLVERIYKAGAEEVSDNAEWMQKHGKPLFDIDDDGYIVIATVGLHEENWKNKAVRNEYLHGWCADLEEESNALAADFIKNELPYLNGGDME